MIELFRVGFLTITLTDILDIIIVTLVVGYLFHALKNTIAGKVLVWVFFLVGAYFASELLALNAVHWLLEIIVSVWFIAFIVLFQPELRRLLLNLSRTSFFTFLTRTDIRNVIAEILKAVKEMSERHMGALIVIRRNHDIKMTIETGIPIQGKVTKELLLTIFNPRSPLHDGAVVIYNDTIEVAGAILPLSTVSKYRGRNLGTRHRAALGLAEQTDAIVIVVSEETGRISIAENGKLTIGVTLKELESILTEKLLSEDESLKEEMIVAT